MLFFVETIIRQTFNSFIAVRFTTCISLMKRTRSTLKTHSVEEKNIDDIDTDEMKTKSKVYY